MNNKTLNNIASLVSNTPKYKGIESKLDFTSFANEAIYRPNKRNVLKVAIPVTAICMVAVIAAIVIPITLKHQSNVQSNQIAMKPISNDVLSFYLKNTSFGSNDIPSGTSVGMLYNTYKQKPEQMADLAQKKEIFSLSAESSLRCYYVTKEVLDAVDQQFVPPSDFMLPWRGLTAYCYGYNHGSWSDDLKNAQLMEVVIDAKTNQIDTNINDYYLLDIVRYYNDPNIDDFNFIDFISYSEDGNQVLINLSESKEFYKYCSCTIINPNKLQKRINYSYVYLLDYHSFEITQEDGIEVVNDTFGYLHRDDPHYYDEIDNCIIRKTYIKSQTNCDFYDVTFDYEELVKLFGF